MATTPTSRTNTFAVRGLDDLTTALAGYEVTVHHSDDASTVWLSRDGSWTEAIADRVGARLRPGQVAVFMHTDAPVDQAYAFMATRTHTVQGVPSVTV